MKPVKDFSVEGELASMLGGVESKRLSAITDPNNFIFKYCYTLDPHDKENPIKLMPNKEYLRYLVQSWLAEDLVLLVKSRQMMATWLFVALHLWEAMTKQGRVIFFVSKKEADAGFDSPLSLLSRAWFIYERLPEELKSYGHKTLSPPKIVFPRLNSVIHGMSQDSDGLRTYTASNIFADELAFQERSEESYAAMKPTIDGGGKFVGVSTPNGKRNLFYKLVHDVQE